MTAYYNEVDPYCAEWLRNLIAAGHLPAGDVDERPIEEVTEDDVRHYTQAHFFAGIGGWSYAARLAGWPDDRPLWTGSPPCQGLSSATRGRPRQQDMWPCWYTLVEQCRPVVIAGEQVPKAAWIDQVASDLKAMDYAFGAVVLPAYLVGADHERERSFFVAHANSNSQPGGAVDAKMEVLPRCGRQSDIVAHTDGLSGRMGKLRAYGNAIVPQVGAAVLRAVIAEQWGDDQPPPQP